MDNPRPEKVAVVQEVRERLSSANAALLTDYRGLKVDELARLRQAVREAGGEYRIYKNTLARLAVRELGMDHVEELLEGPTAITFVEGDAVLVAKSLREFARTSPNLIIKGGILGTTKLSAADTTALADVAPREVLLAQLAGLLAAPLRQMAGLLQALPRNFAYGLAALVDARQKAGETLAPATTDEAPAPAPTDEAPASGPADEAPATAEDTPAPAPVDEAPAAPTDEAPAAPVEDAQPPEASPPSEATTDTDDSTAEGTEGDA